MVANFRKCIKMSHLSWELGVILGWELGGVNDVSSITDKYYKVSSASPASHFRGDHNPSRHVTQPGWILFIQFVTLKISRICKLVGSLVCEVEKSSRERRAVNNWGKCGDYWQEWLLNVIRRQFVHIITLFPGLDGMIVFYRASAGYITLIHINIYLLSPIYLTYNLQSSNIKRLQGRWTANKTKLRDPQIYIWDWASNRIMIQVIRHTIQYTQDMIHPNV